MALTKALTVTDNYGEQIKLPSVYIRIERFEGTKAGMVVDIAVYKDPSTDRQIASDTIGFIPDMTSSANFISQGYAAMKGGKYSDCTDC